MIVEVYEKNLEHGDVLRERNTGHRKEKKERENNEIFCIVLCLMNYTFLNINGNYSVSHVA